MASGISLGWKTSAVCLLPSSGCFECAGRDSAHAFPRTFFHTSLPHVANPWIASAKEFLPTFRMPCSSAAVNFTFKSAFFASSMFHAVVVVLLLPASPRFSGEALALRFPLFATMAKKVEQKFLSFYLSLLSLS